MTNSVPSANIPVKVNVVLLFTHFFLIHKQVSHLQLSVMVLLLSGCYGKQNVQMKITACHRIQATVKIPCLLIFGLLF